MSNTAVKQAHVKLGNEEKTVPAGQTMVSVLKTELGVAADAVLWLVINKQTPDAFAVAQDLGPGTISAQIRLSKSVFPQTLQMTGAAGKTPG